MSEVVWLFTFIEASSREEGWYADRPSLRVRVCVYVRVRGEFPRAEIFLPYSGYFTSHLFLVRRFASALGCK